MYKTLFRMSLYFIYVMKLVYLIKMAELLPSGECQLIFKIGKTKDLKQRLNPYDTCCPGYQVIGLIPFEKIAEKQVFSIFSKYRRIGKRRLGLRGTEFFSYSPEIIEFFERESVLNQIYLGNTKLREVHSLEGIIDDCYLPRIKPDFIDGAIRKPLENRLIKELISGKINTSLIIHETLNWFSVFPTNNIELRLQMESGEIDLRDLHVLSEINKYFWGYVIKDGKIITGQEKVIQDIRDKIWIDI